MDTLRDVDLNLLVALAVLLEERSVSKAARRLSVGQSGMSGILARLRSLVGDPLLLRVGREMRPTPRALQLGEELRPALLAIRGALDVGSAFEPSTCERTFTLGVNDDHELLFAASLCAALHREAPRARLVFRPTHVHSVRDALDNNAVDAALTVRSEHPSWHAAHPLFTQHFRCLWAPSQFPEVKRITLKRYLAADHALVTFRGDLSSQIDGLLAERGLERRVAVGVSGFAALPPLLARRPLFATVPSAVARRFCEDYELCDAPPPFATPTRTLRLVFRRRDAALGAQQWFRGLVERTILASWNA